MKKINSIGYAHKIIGGILLFLCGVPLVCYVFNLLFQWAVLRNIMRISFGIGLLILVFFVGLLTVEFHQDKVINRKYPALKQTKLALGNGVYECQSCGNRQVKESSKECGVCGMRFLQERSKRV